MERLFKYLKNLTKRKPNLYSLRYLDSNDDWQTLHIIANNLAEVVNYANQWWFSFEDNFTAEQLLFIKEQALQNIDILTNFIEIKLIRTNLTNQSTNMLQETGVYIVDKTKLTKNLI